MLDTSILTKIKTTLTRLEQERKLLTQDKLKEIYEGFRKRFGADTLSRLSGEDLLTTLHDHGNRDSLVYWLEFKNDDEFPAVFGSIAGGSALKFGIYRRNLTGEWMTGNPRDQVTLRMEQAIEISTKHRDQLVAGNYVLSKFEESDHKDYSLLQTNLEIVAPDIIKYAWVHKYFSLLFPNILDEIHQPSHQRYHLIKLIQIPHSFTDDKRYIMAGQFLDIANQLGTTLHHLTRALYEVNGFPHKYWRVIIDESNWDSLLNEQCITLGWGKVGSLEGMARDAIRGKIMEEYRGTPAKAGQIAGSLLRFFKLAKRDIVVATNNRNQCFGIGVVIDGEYLFDDRSENPHRKSVHWLITGDVLPQLSHESPHMNVIELTNQSNLIEIENALIEVTSTPRQQTASTPKKEVTLEGVLGKIQEVLRRKGQVILYGPPGTSKSYYAEKTALELSSYDNFGKSFNELTSEEQKSIIGAIDGEQQINGFVRTCCFHPSYGYEDFVEGYRPDDSINVLRYERKSGIFKQICEDAKASDKMHFLIIDEINRGDVPRIFGDLLSILESNKRGKTVILPTSQKPFVIPPNVFIIGTMNTADRSITVLDAAMRRRFGFIELLPDTGLLQETVIKGIPLGSWLDSLNEQICNLPSLHSRNLQFGHAYFFENEKPITSIEKFSRIIHEEIIPQLEELCYEDYSMLETLIGNQIVNRDKRRINHEIFELNNQEQLIQALTSLFPDLATSPQSTSYDEENENHEEIDDEDTEE